MTNGHKNPPIENIEKLKEIPKLTRRYAENRTAPLVVFSSIFIVLFGAVYLSVYFFLKAQFILAVIMMILYIAEFLYFVIKWDKHEVSYFTKTGIPQSKGIEQIRKFLSLPLIACTIIQAIMGQYNVFPAHLGVPISALYICPLLIFANWRWVPGSFIGYLWAGLYGGWAIAILFNVPILTFSGGGLFKPGNEICLTTPVTGAITGLIAYIYSRYALKKLKTTVHLQENSDE